MHLQADLIEVVFESLRLKADISNFCVIGLWRGDLLNELKLSHNLVPPLD